MVVCKPPLQSNNCFLNIYTLTKWQKSGIYVNKVVLGNFNLEPTNPVMTAFMGSQNL